MPGERGRSRACSRLLCPVCAPTAGPRDTRGGQEKGFSPSASPVAPRAPRATGETLLRCPWHCCAKSWCTDSTPSGDVAMLESTASILGHSLYSFAGHSYLEYPRYKGLAGRAGWALGHCMEQPCAAGQWAACCTMSTPKEHRKARTSSISSARPDFLQRLNTNTCNS